MGKDSNWFFGFNWGNSSVLELHRLQLCQCVFWHGLVPPQQTGEPMHPNKVVQRKTALSEVPKALGVGRGTVLRASPPQCPRRA